MLCKLPTSMLNSEKGPVIHYRVTGMCHTLVFVPKKSPFPKCVNDSAVV